MLEIKGDLVPAIVQDAESGEVLMLAYMNREALAKTLETGKAHFWSRSRKKLWLKGESSGHFQKVVEARIDCDQDAILLKVVQEGGACHTGYRSCFYRDLEGNVVGEKVFDPEEVYR
ncbi:MAG TPA: phosphoribosyl-AMP cyclohydrolase [Methanothrix sp.]|mgnify:FL=1|nr:phosphoribosyl-AMP cyclohydrolase [Methanothrix sp.]HRW83620.1 phosphoribosyl-AMP cyclohydrolase [Methanothrix sp.]